MHKVLNEAQRLASSNQISASFDGSWMRRGRKSNVELVTCISLFTNKMESMSATSSVQNVEEEVIGDKCGKNYEGSSGGMETKSVLSIITHIFEKYDVKITRFLEDGDSRAFANAKANLSWDIDKLECTNHVSKRMGSRLRKRKLEIKDLKLIAKGRRKGLEGQWWLTDAAIDKIQSFYSFIIYESKGGVDAKKDTCNVQSHSIHQ